ncbi:MAG TPA: hypothetical protein VG456_04280 [Candidatus Sulfopaludibacter sp.]|jgi:hypothetical protein|nr:hypothetical protein [Candidatus Sulfopaludibacter sp.]
MNRDLTREVRSKDLPAVSGMLVQQGLRPLTAPRPIADVRCGE